MIFVGATSGIVVLVIIVMLFLCIRLSGRSKDKQREKEREFSDDIIPEVRTTFKTNKMIFPNYFEFCNIFFVSFIIYCISIRKTIHRIVVGKKTTDHHITAITSLT